MVVVDVEVDVDIDVDVIDVNDILWTTSQINTVFNGSTWYLIAGHSFGHFFRSFSFRLFSFVTVSFLFDFVRF